MPNCRTAAVVFAVGLVPQVVFGSELPRRYDGYRVVRLTIERAEQLDQLRALGADVWSEAEGVGPLDVMLAPGQLAQLDQLGLAYTVWIDDVQRFIDQQRAGAPRAWFDDYHAYADIVAYLDQLATAYPMLAQTFALGTTLENRTIWGLRIASPNLPPTAPAVVYFGAVHAREWIATTVPSYVATHLLTQYGTDPVVTDLVDHVEFFLIPVGNPDGYEYTWGPDRLWRKNRRDNGNGTFGVDINRNWGYAWGGDGSSSTPSSGTYRGPAPFSEPETRALRDLFLNHPNIRAQNDLHSYSQLLLYPWGHTAALPPDDALFAGVGLAMRQLILGVHAVPYTYGPIYTTIYPVSGDSVDWTYALRGIFAWSFELRDTGQYGFLLPAVQIVPTNEEILPALLHLTDSAPVRASQFNFPNGRPPQWIAGQDTTIGVAITSGVEPLDVGSARVHYRYDPAAAYVAAPLAYLGGAWFEAGLPATHCASAPEYYFSIVGSNGLLTAPPDAPNSVFTAAMVSGTIVFSNDLSADPGWTATGQWAWGQPTGGGGVHGGPDPTGGHTGSNVYGYNLAGDYANLLPEQHLTSGPIDCTGQFGLRLAFWRWLGVEAAPYDRARVRASSDGVTWVTVWENTTEVADEEWTLQDHDISAVADDQPSVYLRWTMGPTDSGWAYCGWNVDDIQIYATGCEGRKGDKNGDRRIDLTDFGGFVPCLSGPGGGVGPDCGVFDFDADGDVDGVDFSAFQADFTGS